jgi:hypothetical protein
METTMYATIQKKLEATWELYRETHIVPTEENFFYQINNNNVVYLILYWLNTEHLYPLFVQEDMDLDSIRLMKEEDFEYFNIDHIEIFKDYVQWLQ